MPTTAASYTLPQTGIVVATPASIVAALAPVVECIQPAPTFQIAPVTVVCVPVRHSSGESAHRRSHDHQEEEGCVLLRAFTDVFMTTDTLRTCQLFKDMTTLPIVFEAGLPAFQPVPPKLQSREEVYLQDETSFECWLYVNSWHSQLIDSVMDVVRKETEGCDHCHSLSDEQAQVWELFRS